MHVAYNSDYSHVRRLPDLDQLGRVEGVSVRISKPFEMPTLLHLIARISNGDLPKDLHVDAYSRSFSQSLFVDNNCVH
jgi:hypothetical protein